jgi:2-polyprenyl-6-methoxyphenol hydroxylase-like FAD-dependent oxidoreductase
MTDRWSYFTVNDNDSYSHVKRSCHRSQELVLRIPRLLKAMRKSTDFYFGDVAQVKLPRWSNGRVVLLGDAAYCPSPFSGQGTSLALVGAYVLARELQRSPADVCAAFQRYESRMRPYVELNQALVDLDRTGPIPDDIMNTAKNGITFDDGDTVGLRPIMGEGPFPADPDTAAYS